ncbi:uncharacterized protein LOC116343295 isoform X2 [Contarinia nasturtii]|uniref:uncharacterized protein LOC116343295 isoform X2 n=1 Tax=Contarinia nasturtii TaxID=265458 RepID=UPI0012D418C8|nr:uncharacterized protein LOC116343295 isoform X2 [Contarinia nasturtii]
MVILHKAPLQTTTKRPSPTPADLLVTIKDFHQPQQSYKNFNLNVQSTPLPVFNPQTIKQSITPAKQSKRPQRVENFLGIGNILQQQHSSDVQKLDQIIDKLNRTGSLARVNVQNPTRYGPTTKLTLPNVDQQKDSKELKVQFVLDCGLKDMAETTLNSPQSVYQKKVPIQYPSYSSSVFNQRVPTKVPSQKGVVYYIPPTKSVKVTTTTAKPRIKNVYVDPPLVSEISDTFENVYNYFENALTTKVKVRPSEKKAKKRPIKRSTVGYRITAPTTPPNYRYTQGHGGQNGQKLTTKIHVTSEYVGKEPSTERAPQSEVSYGSVSISDEYDSGSYDDDDDDRDESDDYYDFSLTGDDDDDYDDDDESDEDVYVKPPPNKINVYRSNKKKRKNVKRRKSNSGSSHPIQDSESDEDDDYGGLTMGNMGKYFQRTYDTLSGFVPAFPSIFGSDDYEDNDDDDDGDKDNESKKRNPKLKYPLYSKYQNNIDVEEKKNNRWYDKFFFGSDSEETTPTSIPHVKLTTEPGFFSWLSGSGEVTTEKTVVEQTQTEKNSWFSNLFSKGDSTTTVKPEATTQSTDGKKWIEMLSAHMATMQTPSSQSSSMNRTNVLRRVKYDDYQIWRVTPSTQAHLEFLRESKDTGEFENVRWLKGPAMRGPNDILVPPEINKEVQELLEYESIPYEVIVWDLEKAIKYENPIMSRRQKIELEKEQGHPMTWYRYHNFEDIAIYLDYLQLTYPDLVELIHIGRSFEGRPLMVVKISFDATESEMMAENAKKNKPKLKTRRKKKVIRPGVFIEAGVHGREWISPAVASWIIKELVKYNNTEDGNTEKEILRSVDWYIMPVSNPDGYEYSLNYDRMWRKTRSKLPEAGSVLNLALKWLKRDPSIEAADCYGTDPDRNYNTDWQMYGSSSVCSEFYVGPKALSEPETKALASFLEENKKSLSLFISLQSYGQYITYPSTQNSRYDASQRSNDLRDMAEVAVNALRDFASSGRYTVDNTNEMSDLKSGTSADYAMHKIGIKYSYTIELRDTGTQGYLLSPSYIDTTGLETYEMIKAMVDYL